MPVLHNLPAELKSEVARAPPRVGQSNPRLNYRYSLRHTTHFVFENVNLKLTDESAEAFGSLPLI